MQALFCPEIPAARLTVEKTARIIEHSGYKLSGFVVLNDETNARGIIEMSAVRWLTNAEMWWLMHTSANFDMPPLTALGPKDKEEIKFAYRHKPTGKWCFLETFDNSLDVSLHLVDDFVAEGMAYKARNIIEEDLLRSTMNGERYAALNLNEFELVEIEVSYKFKSSNECQ